MRFPILPEPIEVARHFTAALAAAQRVEEPYRTWRVKDALPEAMCVGILSLPIAPPQVGVTDGTRGSFNDKRTFFTPREISRHEPCRVLAEALQMPMVARQFAETCEAKVENSHLRIEYIQDIDGAWLEPHRDIPEKLFSMVIYLCTGPDAPSWGTDIYDHDRKLIGSNPPEFDSAVIFIAGPHSWHGFEKRKLEGIRRLMEINYVSTAFRSREQLCFPDRPITAVG